MVTPIGESPLGPREVCPGGHGLRAAGLGGSTGPGLFRPSPFVLRGVRWGLGNERVILGTEPGMPARHQVLGPAFETAVRLWRVLLAEDIGDEFGERVRVRVRA